MLRSQLLAICAIAAVACSSGDASDGGPTGTQSSVDAGAAVGAADGASDASAPDGALDAQAVDAQAPAPPSCAAGDRSEWSGVIPSTRIAVAVCSACGESYVVAANGGAAADVTVDNGTSMITAHVPAGATTTSAKIADKAIDGTVTVCAGAHACVPAAQTVNQKYCNPYRSITNLRRERIDQGVDFGGSGPIYAIGPGTIDLYRNRNDTGWPGGTFMSYKITAGPAAGKVVFLAENIDLDPALHSGSFVYSGTVLGTMVNASPDTESGWGLAGAGYTAEHACYTEGCMTALGSNFNDFLVCLKTPSGVPGTSGCCPSSAGYPSNWCALVDAWQ